MTQSNTALDKVWLLTWKPYLSPYAISPQWLVVEIEASKYEFRFIEESINIISKEPYDDDDNEIIGIIRKYIDMINSRLI